MSDTGKYIFILGIVALAVIAVIAIGSPSIGESRTTEAGVSYRIFYIEEMPCVYVEQGYGNAKTGGPSCDWSKWKGGKK